MQSPKRTKKKTNREFVDELYAVNPAITVLGRYANNKTKLAVKCNVCGHEWSAVPKDLLQGHGCPKCSYKSRGKRKRKTNEEFVEQLHCLNPLIKPLDKYSTSTTKILVECLSCGNKWSATPHSLLAGSGCPVCVRKNAGLANALSALNCKDSASATAKFSESLHDVNSSIVVLGEYRGLRKPIEAKCLHCGNVWLPIAGALLRGNGCPECNRSSTSFVEQYIYYSLRRCCDDETTIINRDREAIGRELDVYIPSHSFAVEYGAWYWHKDRIQADEEKRDECKQKGIRLITIYDSAPATEKSSGDVFFYSLDLAASTNRAVLNRLVKEIIEQAGFPFVLKERDFRNIARQAYRKSRRTSTNEFASRLATISPTIKVLGEYKGAQEYISVRCERCGRVWNATPANLLNGSGCLECSGNAQKTTEQFVEELKAISPHIEVLGEYTTALTKILVRDRRCGHEWEATPNHLLEGKGCRQCSQRKNAAKRLKTTEQFAEELKAISPHIEVLGEYSTASTKILVKDRRCGHEWEATPHSLLRGNGCPNCSPTKRLDTDTFKERLSRINPDIVVIGEYVNYVTKIDVESKTCRHRWSARAGNLLKGSGCPICRYKRGDLCKKIDKD